MPQSDVEPSVALASAFREAVKIMPISRIKAIFSTTWILLRRGHCRSLPFAVPQTAFWAPDPVPNAEIDVQDLAGYDNRLAVDRRLIVPCYTPWSSLWSSSSF